MSTRSWLTKFALLVLLAGGFMSTASAQGRVTLPAIPAASGDQCVEPTDVMRRDHMKFLLHQRDETVHGGIRGARHSLVDCIDCHVQPVGPAQEPPRASDPQHFCSSCHVFAGVKVDCFECHADRPMRSTYLHKLEGERHHLGAGDLTADDLDLLVTRGKTDE